MKTSFGWFPEVGPLVSTCSRSEPLGTFLAQFAPRVGLRGPRRKHGTPVSGWQQHLMSQVGVSDHAPAPREHDVALGGRGEADEVHRARHPTHPAAVKQRVSSQLHQGSSIKIAAVSLTCSRSRAPRFRSGGPPPPCTGTRVSLQLQHGISIAIAAVSRDSRLLRPPPVGRLLVDHLQRVPGLVVDVDQHRVARRVQSAGQVVHLLPPRGSRTPASVSGMGTPSMHNGRHTAAVTQPLHNGRARKAMPEWHGAHRLRRPSASRCTTPGGLGCRLGRCAAERVLPLPAPAADPVGNRRLGRPAAERVAPGRGAEKLFMMTASPFIVTTC